MTTRREAIVFGLLLFACPTLGLAERRTNLDLLAYETGLSRDFLEKYQIAAQKLNVGSAESLEIILEVTARLKSITPGDNAYDWLMQSGSYEILSLVRQGYLERAVEAVFKKMRLSGPATRVHFAETLHMPLRFSLLFDEQDRSEIEIQSFETGLPINFLEQFQRAAKNVGFEESSGIIGSLAARLTDFRWYGPAQRRLSEIGASSLAGELVSLMKAGDVQSAVEKVLEAMHHGPRTRYYMAQAFGIPESATMIYDELLRLRSG
jgi:hypothetical protein